MQKAGHLFAFCTKGYIIKKYARPLYKTGGKEAAAMDVFVGDTIQTKKPHPCGASTFTVLRVGMDFRIRCTGCGREVMLPRAKIEKNIKKVIHGRQ